MKTNVKSLRYIMLVIVVIFTVLLSKTYYFGILHKSTYQYVYFFVVLLGFVLWGVPIRKSKFKQSFLAFLPLFILFLINILIHFSGMNSTNINQVLGIMLTFAIAMIASSYIPKHEFATWYIRILCVYSIISIVCWLIAITNKTLALSLCQPGYAWNVPVGYSWFYTWGWNGVIFSRNSGPFWEAGAFQGFIILAMLMLLYGLDQGEIKKRKTVFLLLSITLLTTQSTMGYILAIVLFLTQMSHIQTLFGKISKHIRFLIPIVLLVAIVIFIIKSGNITNKISGASSDSATIRFSDFTGGIAMVLQGGLFGFGETALRDNQRILLGISTNDSVGLFQMAYTYGLVFAVYYIILMTKRVKAFFEINKLTDYIVIVLIFLCLHMTEGIWWLPVYIMILLYNDKVKKVGSIKA